MRPKQITQINSNKKINMILRHYIFDNVKGQVILCISLTILVFFSYIFAKDYIEEMRAVERFNTEYCSENEFLKTIDCAPIIAQYGVEEKYRIEFELKTEIPGNVIVYFQNGSTSKYKISKEVNATTEFQKYVLEVEPELGDMNEKAAHLAFYGGYDSGVIPTVRRIKFEVLKQE